MTRNYQFLRLEPFDFALCSNTTDSYVWKKRHEITIEEAVIANGKKPSGK